MNGLYATDWRQCAKCGGTRPLPELSMSKEKDPVLDLVSTLYTCRDAKTCAAIKAHRDELLERERGLSPDVPIRERSK